MTDIATDIVTAGLLLLFVLAVVVFFWLWSRHNEKASVERIKKYQAPLEVDTTPGPPIDALPSMARGDLATPEMAQDLMQQLDGKVAAINRLLQSAQEHTARLERAIEEAKRLGK